MADYQQRIDLAEKLHREWQMGLDDPTSVPSFHALPTEQRNAWYRVADKAIALVTEACATRLGNVVIERMASDDPDVRDSVPVIAWSAQLLRGKVA